MSREMTSPTDVDIDSERHRRQQAAQGRMQSLREAGVCFLFETAEGMDANAVQQVYDFTEVSCDRLGITLEELRFDQWIDSLLRYNFGGKLVATLNLSPDDLCMLRGLAVLAAVDPTSWDMITQRLNSLNGLLTDDERREITVQIVPRWSHDRPAIVSPLALHDPADTAESSPRPVGARTAADD